MRVCPKCGHSDNPLWRNCIFSRDHQFMRIEDFKEAYPHLAEKIETHKYVRDGQFLYHKGTKYVLRKEPVSWNVPFWEQFERQGRKFKDMASHYNALKKNAKFQKRLFEEKEIKGCSLK